MFSSPEFELEVSLKYSARHWNKIPSDKICSQFISNWWLPNPFIHLLYLHKMPDKGNAVCQTSSNLTVADYMS